MEVRLLDLAPIDPLGVPFDAEAARRGKGPLGRPAPPCPTVILEEDGDA
jgi:hypothetical protein